MEERAILMFLQIWFISFRCFENQNWRLSFAQNLFPISSSVHIQPAPNPIPHFSFSLPFSTPFQIPLPLKVLWRTRRIYFVSLGLLRRGWPRLLPPTTAPPTRGGSFLGSFLFCRMLLLPSTGSPGLELAGRDGEWNQGILRGQVLLLLLLLKSIHFRNVMSRYQMRAIRKTPKCAGVTPLIFMTIFAQRRSESFLPLTNSPACLLQFVETISI